MTADKRSPSSFRRLSKHHGERVRQSRDTAKTRDAQEVERKLRQTICERLVMDKVVAMSFEEAVERSYATVIFLKKP